MAGLIATAKQALAVLLPKKLNLNGGTAYSPTFNPTQRDQTLVKLGTDSHLQDTLTYRQSSTDDDIISYLMIYDSDVSTAVHSFLTVADTPMRWICKTMEGQLDTVGQAVVDSLMRSLTNTMDYSNGFTMGRDLTSRNEKFRHMILKRGALASELVLDRKAAIPITDLRLLDPHSLEWTEKENGFLKPSQSKGSGDAVSLDFPTVFYATFRQDTNSPYSKSFFISTINTVYARKQVIEDLYRIMNQTGYPRIRIKVLEEVAMKTAPDNIKRGTAAEKQNYIGAILNGLTDNFQNVSPEQPLAHTDSVEVDILNERSSAVALDITPIIKTLSEQNQTSLKIMGTLLGRGESGVNTASVEARIFALSAGALNKPIAAVWGQALTLALRLQSGSLSYVEVSFDEPELRSTLELEPSRIQQQARLHKDLSLGLISDAEYTLQMYGRLPLSGAPALAGTRFLDPAQAIETGQSNDVNAKSKQPNALERSGSRESDKQASNNINK